MKIANKIRLTMYLFGLILIVQNCFAQKFIDTYYQHNWQETTGADDASFFSHSVPTDSGWYRKDYFIHLKGSLQMTGLFEDKEMKIQNGTFRWYYANGKLKTYGIYSHGQKEGMWLNWYSDGTLKDSSTYIKSSHSGISLSWYKNGYPKDSMNINKEGFGLYAAWFSNGAPSEIGRYKDFKRNGKWAYYHANGKMSSLESYNNDSLISFQYFDEDGVQMSETTSRNTEALFPKGDRGWNNYLGNNLHYPGNVTIAHSDHIVVVVEFTIDENGNIINSEVIIPVHSSFDNEALRAISQCPKWSPAIAHNRRVSQTMSFPIKFSQGFF